MGNPYGNNPYQNYTPSAGGAPGGAPAAPPPVKPVRPGMGAFQEGISRANSAGFDEFTGLTHRSIAQEELELREGISDETLRFQSLRPGLVLVLRPFMFVFYRGPVLIGEILARKVGQILLQIQRLASIPIAGMARQLQKLNGIKHYLSAFVNFAGSKFSAIQVKIAILSNYIKNNLSEVGKYLGKAVEYSKDFAKSFLREITTEFKAIAEDFTLVMDKLTPVFLPLVNLTQRSYEAFKLGMNREKESFLSHLQKLEEWGKTRLQQLDEILKKSGKKVEEWQKALTQIQMQVQEKMHELILPAINWFLQNSNNIKKKFLLPFSKMAKKGFSFVKKVSASAYSSVEKLIKKYILKKRTLPNWLVQFLKFICSKIEKGLTFVEKIFRKIQIILDRIVKQIKSSIKQVGRVFQPIFKSLERGLQKTTQYVKKVFYKKIELVRLFLRRTIGRRKFSSQKALKFSLAIVFNALLLFLLLSRSIFYLFKSSIKEAVVFKG